MAAAGFFYQVGQTNRFSSFVAAEIERGGLHPKKINPTNWTVEFTDESKARIADENDNHYNGRYTIEILSKDFPDADIMYGDQVHYKIKGKYYVLFSESLFNGMAGIDISDTGSASIQVRKLQGAPR